MASDVSPTCSCWPRFWLFLAMVAAAVLELAVAARSPIIAKDGIRFIRIARALEREPRAVIQREDQHPGYPALIGLAHSLIPRDSGVQTQRAWEAAARLPPMVTGVACVGLVWLLARTMFDTRIAAVAALLMVPLPLFRRNASDTLSDTPHLAFYLLAAWLACEGFAGSGSALRRAVCLVASGLVSGLAFWIRPEGLSVALMAALVAGGWWAAGCVAAWRRVASCREQTAASGQTAYRLAWMVLVSSAAAAVVLPYVALAGKLTSKKNPLVRPAAQSEPSMRSSLARVQAGPHLGWILPTGLGQGELAVAGGGQTSSVTAGSSTTDLAMPTTAGEQPATAPGRGANQPQDLVGSAPALWQPVCTTASRSEALRTIGILAEPAAGERHADELERPEGFWRTLAAGLYQFGREGCEGLMYFLLVPLAAGHFAPGRPRPRPAAFWFLVVLAAWHFGLLILLYFMAGYISHRHVMPLMAIGMPCTAAGTVWLAERLAAWGRRLLGLPSAQAQARFLLPALVSIMLAAMLPKCLEPGYLTHRSVVAAARWIGRHARPGAAVLATSSYVGYYSGLPGVLLGVEAPDLETALRASPTPDGWDYVVLEVDQRQFDKTAEQLRHLGYKLLFRLPAHTRYPWLEVVVMQGRCQSATRHAAVDLSRDRAPPTSPGPISEGPTCSGPSVLRPRSPGLYLQEGATPQIRR